MKWQKQHKLGGRTDKGNRPSGNNVGDGRTGNGSDCGRYLI
jgi:hypothetical protein